LPSAKEFWELVTNTGEWKRSGSLLREVPVMKGLAKAWFMVFLARRNNQLTKAEKVRTYIRRTKFDGDWLDSVPGVRDLTIPADNDAGIRFSPSHNEIVTKIVAHILA
jgi:hypothetical protein